MLEESSFSFSNRHFFSHTPFCTKKLCTISFLSDRNIRIRFSFYSFTFPFFTAQFLKLALSLSLSLFSISRAILASRFKLSSLYFIQSLYSPVLFSSIRLISNLKKYDARIPLDRCQRADYIPVERPDSGRFSRKSNPLSSTPSSYVYPVIPAGHCFRSIRSRKQLERPFSPPPLSNGGGCTRQRKHSRKSRVRRIESIGEEERPSTKQPPTTAPSPHKLKFDFQRP